MDKYLKQFVGMLDKLPDGIAYWVVGLISAVLGQAANAIGDLNLDPMVAAVAGSIVSQAILYWTPVTQKFGVKKDVPKA